MPDSFFLIVVAREPSVKILQFTIFPKIFETVYVRWRNSTPRFASGTKHSTAPGRIKKYVHQAIFLKHPPLHIETNSRFS